MDANTSLTRRVVLRVEPVGLGSARVRTLLTTEALAGHLGGGAVRIALEDAAQGVFGLAGLAPQTKAVGQPKHGVRRHFGVLPVSDEGI